MITVQVEIKRVISNASFELPKYESSAASGMDLRADLDGPVELLPGRLLAVPTGIAVAIPDGYEAQVRPRSGLALRHQVTVLNSPGTIDSDYRGEISVLLVNLGQAAILITPGTRVAQLVVTPVVRVNWVEVEGLTSTARSTEGFGSTGTH
jgi:dUTP pyrophosphatase